jgi:hypothetical protein
VQISRAAVAACLGASIGALCFAVVFAWRPTLAFEMDRNPPRALAAGFYPVEREGDRTFAWIAKRADVKLAQANRRTSWQCEVRARGASAKQQAPETIELAVDGLTVARSPIHHEFLTLVGTVPAASRQGFTLTISTSSTFVPGPGDRRELGLQIDRVGCRPDGVALPPARPTVWAAMTAAIFGAALGFGGLAVLPLAAILVLVSACQALLLAASPAPYTTYGRTTVWLAGWLAGVALGLVAILNVRTRPALHSCARFVVFLSAAILYLKLSGLLHPAKALVDALFQAHRFQYVLAGNYYFTQTMPSGVSFPYAIGLYLFALPGSLLTTDYVSLLRIVVSGAEVIAGGLLYPMLVRRWGDRLTAALAVGLFSVVPLTYGVIGDANMTNAFGQAVAVWTLVAFSLWPPVSWRLAAASGLFLLTALAFLSHVGTFAILAVTLVAMAVLYRVFGDGLLQRTSRVVLVIAVAAGVFAVAAYYGHFGEVYQALERLRPGSASTQTVERALPPAGIESPPADGTHTPIPLYSRLGSATRHTLWGLGWPIVLLAVVGSWDVWRRGARDAVGLLIGAWGIAYLTFVAVAVVPTVDAPFERYAAEFVGRVVLAVYPAAVILAARGAAVGWRAGNAPRALTAALVAWAGLAGIQHLLAWIN